MGGKNTHLNFQDLKRLRDISVVFFDKGFDLLLQELKLKYLLPVKYKIKKDKQSVFKKNGHLQLKKEFPKRLREALEQLGPTFVKLGQLLSLRPDILPLEFTKELEKLQQEVEPVSFDEIRKVLEQEYEQPLHEIFLKIDMNPLGSASLAQVHRAVLLNGQEVAVKIQRPGIKQKIEADIHIMLYIAALLEKHFDELKNLNIVKAVKEFADWTLRELDFVVEGKNADRFRYNFKDEPDIYVPKIFWEHSTNKVLVLELIRGLSIDDVDQFPKYNINRKQLAMNSIQAGFQMFFYDGFFHADPHPGNFLFVGGNRICLYDFGIVGYLNEKLRNKLINLFLSFVNKDMDGYIKHLLSITEISESDKLNYFAKDVSQILSGFMFSEKEVNIGLSFYEVINKAAQYGVVFPIDFVLFGKALVTVEAMGQKIYPELDFSKELTPFVEKVYAKKFKPKNLKYEIQNVSLDYLSLLKNLPEQTRQLLNKIETGKLSVKIDAHEILDIKHEIDRQNDIKILSFVIIALIISSAILLRAETLITFLGFTLGEIGIFVSMLLLIWILILIKRKD